MNRFAVFGVGAVLLASLTACGGGGHEKAPGAAHDSRPALSVATVEVRPVEWSNIYEAPGTVRAATSSTLASKVMSYVREVKVQPGDRVSAGQLLVVLDARDLDTGVRQAQAAQREAQSALLEADSAIAAAKAQLALAQVTFKRMSDLFQKASISNQEFDEAQARLRAAESGHAMAQARRRQVEARIAQAEQGVASAEVMREWTEVRAPFAGVVTEKRAEPGQVAPPGSPLITVERAGAYRLEAPVDESLLAEIRVGQKVSVRFDTAGLDLAGTVQEIVPAIDAATRSFLVKVALPGNSLLRSGLFGRMRLARGSRSAIAVPAAAVEERGQLHSVFVADQGTARTRMVTLGDRREDRVEILSGLAAGERIVYPRPASLADGARLEVRQ